MGWANYYRPVNRTKTFKKVSHYIWITLWKWCRVKHPETPIKILVPQYFTTIGKRKWLFYGEVGTKKKFLFQITDANIQRHIIVMNKNPYLPENQEYFLKKGSRFARNQIWGQTKQFIAKKTRFKCLVCEQIM